MTLREAQDATFAEVAVNAAAPVRQTFTYRVPDGMEVGAGQAVYVPFGSRTLQGIVMEVTAEAGYPEAREIEAVIDPRPLLSGERIAVAKWMSEHYLAPLFDCVSLMLPPGSKQRPLTLLTPLATLEEIPNLGLTERQAAALAYIIEQGEAQAEELKRELGLTNVPVAVSALLRRGFVQRSYRLARPAASPKVVRMLRLTAGEEDARRRAAELRADGSPNGLRRMVVLEALADEEAMPLSRARTLGLTPAVLRDLQAEGLAQAEDVTVVRDPLAGRTYPYRAPPELTADQDAAVREIAGALELGAGAPSHAGVEGKRPVFLLHGVTGSGKTEVYLAALDHAVSLGKRAIVLVPEISLTPQTVRRFGERFPGRVAVMHSGLALGEHHDMWHEIRDGKYDVVIGPRGALFSPQPDLGLVIIDEGHEWTYKQQDPAPRYHARRAAEELCRLAGATLVLGSATPDVESHFRAQEGSYRLLELPDRLIWEDGAVRKGPLPEVEVVDLREELKAGNRSIFSRSLARGIREALAAKEQVMLFLNRRGTASFVQCRDCGYVP
ncbi:MAG TPA: primosomal protein N', partial [Dehalococcoidia bacterium]|nr:primosomal protein N' [Dehalococcoidia bacterium]